MDEELVALAAAGASALVTAMGTDVWLGVRDAAGRLFQRMNPQRRAAIEAELDDNAAMVQQAAEPVRVRQALLGPWVLELSALLAEEPGVSRSLVEMIEQINRAVAGDHRAAIRMQTNTAHDHGTVFAVQNGDQHIYGGGSSTPDH